jgi:putative ABC transport system permease protein
MTDLRFAIRSLRKTPGFTAVAIATLALGIGANTAIFSLVHAVILKPLPYRDPSRLVVAWDTYLPQVDRLGVSITEFQALSDQRDLFSQTAWYRYVAFDMALTAPDAEALQVHTTFASASLFSLLGASPAIGRAFSDREPPNSAILSDQLWRSRFAGDRAIVGRPLRLNGQEFTVIGVMAPEFRLPDFADLWLPAGPLYGDTLTNPVRHSMAFIARLAPGATLPQAEARMQGIARRLAAQNPKTSTGWGMKMAGLQQDLTGNIRPALLMLLGAVALVLLIACANVANLLLSRASGRVREIAVRTALGAGAWRIVRQLLTESLLLAAAGAGLGLVLARAALRALSPVPAALDSTVLLFLIAVSLVTGTLFGLAPALQALRTDHNSIIKSGSRAGGSSNSLRGALVVAEFALAMILVAGAGMLMRSFLHLMHVDPGFEPRGLLTLHLDIPPSRDPVALFHRIEERAARLPGMESVASVNMLPLIATRAASSRFNVPGSPLIDPNALPAAQIRAVSPDYFRAMRIPIRSGRAFTERDLNDPVAIVNESFARRYWPGRDPVGEKFVTGVWGPTPSFSTIVGVVGDVKDFGLDADAALCEYFPGMASNYIVVRAGANAASLAGAVRLAIRQADAGLPVSDLRTMEDVMAGSMRSRRWTMGLLAAFASLALLLALVGIYGVMSWAVTQRTREIGIRMALGAGSTQVLGMVIRYGLGLCGAGLAIGMAGAVALRRVVASFVFGVSAADPAIYAGVVLLMLAVALAACYLPARRASRVDPSLALRWE